MILRAIWATYVVAACIAWTLTGLAFLWLIFGMVYG